jgi:uncharacterized membrane protein
MDENKTVLEIINELANKNTSTENDSMVIQYVLRKMGFNNAIVTCGIVYLEGHGTINSPPTDIHTIAKTLLKTLEKMHFF